MTLPTIDLGRLGSSRTADIELVVREIRAASEEVGFFYVVNHGVPGYRIERALNAAKKFFALPDEDKGAVAVDARHRGYLGFGGAKMDDAEAPDLKESFVYGVEHRAPADDGGAARLVGPNQWPATVPELEEALYSFFLSMLAAGRTLLTGIAMALGLTRDFFAAWVDDPLARGSAIHYPPRTEAAPTRQLGVGAHTDYGLITLLWQDEVGGLEVQTTRGDWVAASPLAGSLVVNVGDLLARWSNDRLKSNPHRVVSSGAADRYSMAVFLDPSYDTVVDPRDCGLGPDTVWLYGPVVAGEHIARRFDSSFSYRRNG